MFFYVERKTTGAGHHPLFGNVNVTKNATKIRRKDDVEVIHAIHLTDRQEMLRV